ncbi:sulfurtransferase [Snodgrassella sp. CFCC 13594]|uniref:sulfurtransferase n=1 Tax=Snodgrassella sp. CFCC 13594 TaxID=1775559 RepID=UPI00082A69B7|nr:rhodanese-like domain-containing protein [Snodgrassella sp. CFCC 13594]
MNFAPVIDAHEACQAWTHHALWLDAQFDLNKPHQGCLNYDSAHKTGAHHIDLEAHLSAPTTTFTGRHPFPDLLSLRSHLLHIGYQSQQPVVIYDQGDMLFAARAWVCLRWLGIESVCVVDGGLPALIAAGASIDNRHPNMPENPAQHAIWSPSLQDLITQEQLQQDLYSRPWLLIDARAPARFQGSPHPLDPRCGHIPGAINRFYQDNLQASGRFLPHAELQQQWLALLNGKTPQEVVHYCGSGVSACVNLLAMAYVGLTGSRLYVGSWSQWAANPNNPITLL